MIGALRISTGALARNAKTLRDLAAPARAAFVVKSNAYGHGLVETAKAIEAHADALCVYSIEEGLALRKAGIAVPVIVLGPSPVELLERALEHDLQITIWDADAYLETVANTAQRHGKTFPVQVKIDTGVRRLGVDPSRAPAILQRIARNPGIQLTGIFSHLASAEELDSAFTITQVETLNAAIDGAKLDGAPLRHIAASAAAMLWPQTRLDMVRFGIALYGLWPSKQTHAAAPAELTLEPALSFESVIAAVRKIEAGTAVGYGGTFRAPRPMRVGVVPLGYADGIPRALSNRGAFAVGGKRCPVAGRVCMNMTILDLGSTNARPGDRVVLIGRDGDVAISADDWADWADTINYEIVARLPAGLTRTYVD